MSTFLGSRLSPVREVLDNGIVVLAQENTTTPAVAVNATFFKGTASEPPELPGVAYLMARTLDRGTELRSAEAIAELLDDRGVSLRIWATRHTFSVACICLAEDLQALLQLIGEIVRFPAFPDHEIDKRRLEAITAIRQDEDSTAVRSAHLVAEQLYGPEHPYGRPVKGHLETIDRLYRGDLLGFHRRTLAPSRLALAVAGDVPPLAVMDASAAAFGSWRSASHVEDVVLPPPPRTARSVQTVEMPGKSQADIAYGFTAIRRVDPRYYAYSMLNNVLGQFGLGGRLAENIRERQGMAYYAYSTLDATAGEGPLLIRAGVDPANVERTIEAIDAEVRGLCATGPTAAEMEDTRESLIGSIPRIFETNEAIADYLQSVEQFGLGLDYHEQLPGLLRQVSREEVTEAAREVLDPERAAIGVAGPGA